MNQTPRTTRTLLRCTSCLALVASAASSLSAQNWLEEITLYSETPPPGNIQFDEYIFLRGGTIQSPSDAVEIQQRFDATKAIGGHPFGFISVFNVETDTYDSHPEFADLRIIDIEGNPLEIPWKSTETDPVWWMNTNLPIYQDFLKTQAYDLIDAGADGLNIDEIEGVAGSMVRGGSFGDEDMAAFRAYLDANYSDAELSNQYGINDISTFNYKSYIEANGWVQLYLDSPEFVPLFADFQKFQRVQMRDFMEDYISDVRAYASSAGKSEFPISANLFGLAPHQLIFNDLVDFHNVEYPYRTDFFPPDGHAEPFLKLSHALDRKSILFPSVYSNQELIELDSTDDLMTLWVLEAYASGNGFLHLERYFGGISFSGQRQWFNPNVEHTTELYQFVEDHDYLYKPGDPLAEVGYVYSHPSDFANDFRYDWLGASYALLDSDIQYEIVVMGDDFWLDDRTPASLSNQYDVMVLPYASHLTDAQVANLTDFVDQGGLLIVIGEAGVYDETGVDVSRPSWDALVAEGERTSGAGSVISLNASYGSAYRDERSQNLRQIIADPIESAITPVIDSTSADLVHLSAYEGPVINTLPTYLLHVANTNYSDFQSQIFDSDPFNVTLHVPQPLAPGENWQLYRLEVGHPVELVPYSLEDGDTLTFNVPAQGPHASFMLLAQTDAQALADAVPALDETVLQTAIDEAKAAGQDVSRIEADYAALSDAQSSNNLLEYRRLEVQLNRDIEVLQRPRILFDESLAERNTLSRDRALELQSNNPESVLFSLAAQRLEQSFNFIRNADDELTLEKLQGFDVLFLAAPSENLSAAELAAIETYLDEGGSLLLLGDANYGWSNGITESMGISIAGEPLSTESGVNQFGNAELIGDAGHPSMAGWSSMALSYSGTLQVSSPAVVVGETNSDAWIDIDRDFQQDPGEPTGPFPVAAAYQDSATKVFVIADNSFNDNIVQYTDNVQFLGSVLTWLVDDGLPSVENDMTFAEWTQDTFGTLNPGDEATVWGGEADPDGDGLINAAEYLGRTNANSPDPTPFNRRIEVSAEGSSSAGIDIMLPMRKTPAYVVIERSQDLESWSSYEEFWSDDEGMRLSGQEIEVNGLPTDSFYRVLFRIEEN